MKRIFLFIGVLAVVGFGILIWLARLDKPKPATNKLNVITTIYPLYDMAKNIGGVQAETSLLLPPGVEPHTFEPRPSDIVKINQADIFIYTGKFMEPWAEDVLKSLASQDLIVVEASQGVNLIPSASRPAGQPAQAIDPHIWLDSDNAKIMIKNIGQAFNQKDGKNADLYRQAADNYVDGLTALDSKYQTGLAACQSREIIYGGHYTFGYLAKRYGLKYLAAQGVSPDAAPTAKDLANLVDQINKNKIKYVFYEELTSPKIAETIAQETNAKLLLLNAAHNLTKDQFDAGVSFFDILNYDLNNLKIGLGCQS